MSRFTALYDANVLYPAPLRDLLMHLALTDLFRAKWSAAIHEEWMANVLENREDLTRGQLEQTRDLMDRHVRDCLVTNYEPLIETLALPDRNDRHVLAAAIIGRADLINGKGVSRYDRATRASRNGISTERIFPAHIILGQA